MAKKVHSAGSLQEQLSEVEDIILDHKHERVPQRKKIDYSLNLKGYTWTPKQQEFIDLVCNKEVKLIYVEGPAGSAKTFLGVFCGLMLMNEKRISDLLYIRSIAESASKSFGTLPGELNDKLHPFLMPLYDKLDEILSKKETDLLIKEERIIGMPINYLRGSSFNAKFVLCDEAQNLDYKELTTLITRLGKYSKMIVAGDCRQSDIQGKSGFARMFNLFDDKESRDNGIHCFQFTKDDIVRSGIVKFIAEKLEKDHLGPRKIPMFLEE